MNTSVQNSSDLSNNSLGNNSPENNSPGNNLTFSIHQAIIHDLHASRELLDLLEQEREAMEQRNRKELTDIVSAKTECMQRIDQQAVCRYHILENLHREGSEQEWKALVLEQTNDAIKEDWQQLIDTLHQCRHLNEVNGRLISRGQQTLGKLLSILRGQLDPPQLYNQRGTPESRNSTYSVTKA